MNEEIKRMFVFIALENPICHSIDYKQYYGELMTKTVRENDFSDDRKDKYCNIKPKWDKWLEKCKKAMPNRPQDVKAQARKQLSYEVIEDFKKDKKVQGLFKELFTFDDK